jgi:hypothetical protein
MMGAVPPPADQPNGRLWSWHNTFIHEDSLQQCAVKVAFEKVLRVFFAPVLGCLDGHHASGDIETYSFAACCVLVAETSGHWETVRVVCFGGFG